MRVVKAVKQNYTPSPELLALLEGFRKMVNDCLRVGLAENVTSMKALSKKAYHELAGYDAPTYYRLTAISKAAGILRNHRRAMKKQPKTKKPYATKLMLTDCYGFRVINGELRLPIRAREYVYIPLNTHTMRSIEGYAVRSVCLTACTLSVAFSKETAQIEPAGLIGIDRNLDNVTTVSSNRDVKRYDLSGATRIRATYRMVKSHFRRNDSRIQKQLFTKYGRKEKAKVSWLLHNTSKAIVQCAETEKSGIVMEDLKGIRRLYHKGNGQGRNFRGRMNGWSFYELQRQIEYKTKWEGLPVIYVPPQKTSSTCAICGSRITECAERKVYCSKCQIIIDRDINGAENILARGLRFKPVGLAGEAVIEKPSREVILGVDASQPSLQPKT